MTIIAVNRLSQQRFFGNSMPRVELAQVVQEATPDILRRYKLSSLKTLGFVMAEPAKSYRSCWDDPYKLGWLVVGYGPRGIDHAITALRKMRRSAKTTINSWKLQTDHPGRFHGIVANNSYPREWGDCPYGGAAFLRKGRLLLFGSVDTPQSSKQVDEELALAFLELLHNTMLATRRGV